MLMNESILSQIRVRDAKGRKVGWVGRVDRKSGGLSESSSRNPTIKRAERLADDHRTGVLPTTPLMGYAPLRSYANPSYYDAAMTDYRRYRQHGSTYFFTVNLYDRQLDLLTRHIALLRAAFRKVRAARPFQIDAMVVLPDHLHCLWTLPAGDADYSTRWRLIKRHFSTNLVGFEADTTSRKQKRERTIWQRRFFEHLIRDERDLHVHMDYIHFNPVKHGYVSSPEDWSHSSVHRLLRQGLPLSRQPDMDYPWTNNISVVMNSPL